MHTVSGVVHSLVYQTEKSDHRSSERGGDESPRYSRIPTDCVTLRARHGIEGDRKAGRNPRRQINVMCWETLQDLAQQGWQVAPGAMGEQMVISGLDVAALPPGTRLRLGERAVVEVHGARTGCEWLAQIQGQDPATITGKLGVFVGVLTDGPVCAGDPVMVVEAAPDTPGTP